VQLAIERWTKDLIDTGKRNPLLYYRDLQAGTLTLGGASEAALTAFLGGRRTAVTTLFPSPEALADAL
jgi:hypothetical protein